MACCVVAYVSLCRGEARPTEEHRERRGKGGVEGVEGVDGGGWVSGDGERWEGSEGSEGAEATKVCGRTREEGTGSAHTGRGENRAHREGV